MTQLSLCVVATTALVGLAAAQQPLSGFKPAEPKEPIPAILDAFRNHSVVALSEGTHGNEQSHAFRLALVRSRGFTATVDDVVVEFGNGKYQDLIDRYIAGDAVPAAALRQVWQETTQTTAVWDHDMYEEFFRAIREANAKAAGGHRVRVLLGDPPIDWSRIRGPEDLAEWRRSMAQRDSFPADLIRRELAANRRHLLLIYGAGHLQRATIDTNYEPNDIADSIVARLERDNGLHVYSIWTNVATDLSELQPSVGSWPTPSLTVLRGSVLGERDYTTYVPAPRARFAIRNGKPVPLARSDWRSMRMEDEFDALLYLGRPGSITYAPLSAMLCHDANYLKTRLWRLALTPGNDEEIGRIQKQCGAQ